MGKTSSRSTPAPDKTGLANRRHELFAQALATGKTTLEAYTQAGYKADDGNASKLANRPEVRARVQEITGAAAVEAGVTAERVIAELARIGFADIRQVVSWRPEVTEVEALDGKTNKVLLSQVLVLDSATPSADTAAAIAEVSQGRQSLRIKMHDKGSALEKLGRHLGIFKDVHEHTGKDGAPLIPATAPVVIIERAGPAAARPAPSKAARRARKPRH